jgi:hypothetical protein
MGGDFGTGAEYGAVGSTVYTGLQDVYQRVLVKAATRFSKGGGGFTNAQKAYFTAGLNTLADTRTGQEELWEAILQKGIWIVASEDGPAGDGTSPGPRNIEINPGDKFGLGEGNYEDLRTGHSPDEMSPIYSGRDTDALAVIIGHEMGHELYDYTDDTSKPAINNVLLIENPIRRELGFEPRLYYRNHPLPNGY